MYADIKLLKCAFYNNNEGQCTIYVSSQQMYFRTTSANAPGLNINYFFLVGFRCGVEGRPEFIPLYWYLAFFSEGFRIYKKYKWLFYIVTLLKLYQLSLQCKTQNFSKKSCERSTTITVLHVLQAVKMKQQDWWIIKHGNSQSNSIIFKRAITDYINLQMMGLLFKLWLRVYEKNITRRYHFIPGMCSWKKSHKLKMCKPRFPSKIAYILRFRGLTTSSLRVYDYTTSAHMNL